MWLFIPRQKYDALQSQLCAMEENMDHKDKELTLLHEDLDMAEECLKNLRDNKLDALMCQSLFRSLRSAVEKSLDSKKMDVLIKDFGDNSLAESQALFTSSGLTLKQINQELKAVSERAQASQFAIADLSKSTDRVEKLVTVMQHVMSNTRLLSVNAQIDAAKAELQAEDMASIAKEIEHLAIQSNDATAEITQLLKTIKSQTAQAQWQVNELIDLSASIALAAGTVEDAVVEVIDCAHVYRNKIEQHQLADIIRQAQWEHIAIKSKLCEKLLGNELSGDFNHQSCLFQDWLAAMEASEYYQALPSFNLVKQSDVDFHQLVDDLWCSDKIRTSDAILEKIRELDGLYSAFVDALDQLYLEADARP